MPFLGNGIFTSGEGIASVLVHKKGSAPEMTTMDQTCSETAPAVQHSIEQNNEDRMDCAEPTSSQMPSPPDSRSPTPRFNLDKCPKRLYPLIPPKNYGAIYDHTMYRSSFPQRENIEFLDSLDLRSILTLTTKNDPCDTYNDFVRASSVRHKIMELETNKEGSINMKSENLCEAIMFALNPNHHPVYVHCNQGRHRTGCLVACIRKLDGWSMEEILTEYDTYASPKPRDGDIAFIKQFDPKIVHMYAEQNPHLKWRSDSILGTFDLLAGISRTDMALQVANGSVVSDTSEPGLMLAAPRTIDPALLNGAAPLLNAQATIIDAGSGMSETITEVEPVGDDEMEDVVPSTPPETVSLSQIAAKS
ncbi:Inositol phosphatase SIW14 [Pseudocercospora fuligena]|uniref:Inositol phosphatase SIW14 n=1 Tax=Pseudocercospora fuligena TaxID=685502 RepID=A0A8H6RB83_9PEZI|nr:Inositol phosphatase SIW14 [Pseudocercospora fuligena]